VIAQPSAIIVTRGDVDLAPILNSLPQKWERLVWDNGAQELRCVNADGTTAWARPAEPSSVFGRYRAIDEGTSRQLIYVQDDDVIVSDPRALVKLWSQTATTMGRDQFVVCNMPEEFRHEFYEEHALVGFGAVFQRDQPGNAFERYWRYAGQLDPRAPHYGAADHDRFRRTADVVFTALTNRVLADVPKEDMPYATGEDRMYRQKEHQRDREATLGLALEVRVRPE
jgi:hypothetical protein